MSCPSFEPRGVWTALVTPFDPQGGFDVESFRRLVDYQAAAGVNGIVPCGTTGESPALTWNEHEELVSASVEKSGNSLGVLAGAGSNSTTEAIRGTRDARERGASGVLLVDCYYNGPSSLELRTEYYERILDAVPDIPLVPYVIPGRTGCALGPEDLALLHQAAPDRVPAVKQATGDLDRMRRDRELAGDSLAILSGDDDQTVAMMRDDIIRASGVISVTSNLMPHLIVDLVAAQRAKDEGRTSEISQALAPLLGLVTVQVPSKRTLRDGRELEVTDRFRNPVPVKTMMQGLGMITHGCRPPLGRMTRPGVIRCREALRTVYQRMPQAFEPIRQMFGIDPPARLADDTAWSRLAR